MEQPARQRPAQAADRAGNPGVWDDAGDAGPEVPAPDAASPDADLFEPASPRASGRKGSLRQKPRDGPDDEVGRLICHGFQSMMRTKPHLPSNNSRSEEHTSELQSLMRHTYAVFCLKKKK